MDSLLQFRSLLTNLLATKIFQMTIHSMFVTWLHKHIYIYMLEV